MTDHLEPFNGFGSENPSFKHFLNNLLPPSHGNPCVEDLEEVLVFRKNIGAVCGG